MGSILELSESEGRRQELVGEGRRSKVGNGEQILLEAVSDSGRPSSSLQ
jgi:hypothetical protein